MGKNLTTCEASAFSLRTVWRARPVRLIIGVGLLLAVAIATAGSFAIANLRNNMLADSERELGNLAAVLTDHVERTFETLTLTQLAFAQEVQALSILSADDFARRLSGREIHLLLKEKIKNLRSVRALMLASSEGTIINGSREWPATEPAVSPVGALPGRQQASRWTVHRGGASADAARRLGGLAPGHHRAETG
jgi:hypothetical protein